MRGARVQFCPDLVYPPPLVGEGLIFLSDVSQTVALSICLKALSLLLLVL